MTSSIFNSVKMLSDPTRVRILRLLQREALSVAELQQVLGMGQSRISTQLSLLKKAGLVSDERSGKNKIYRGSLPRQFEKLLEQMGTELAEAEGDFSALSFVLRKRQDQTRAYFDQLAGKFGKEYVPGRSWKSLAEGFLQCLELGVVVDLGAGEGTLAQFLAPQAQEVIAVDNSEKMVEYGSQLIAKNGLQNVRYLLGEIEDIPLSDETVDLAVFSQALHHARRPLRALKEAARILKPGGRVLVLDLVQHQFEQARELYFDKWLGFSEAELDRDLAEAGFAKIFTAVVDREESHPYFQTLLGTGVRLGKS